MSLDETDRRLLAALQEDAQITAAALGARLGLSPSQAARRRQRLEAEGFVTGYGARIPPERLGLEVEAFLRLRLAAGAPAAALAAPLAARPDIVGAWATAGGHDVLLRAVCRDLAALNALVRDGLRAEPAVAAVEVEVVMERLKADAPLPLWPAGG